MKDTTTGVASVELTSEPEELEVPAKVVRPRGLPDRNKVKNTKAKEIRSDSDDEVVVAPDDDPGRPKPKPGWFAPPKRRETIVYPLHRSSIETKIVPPPGQRAPTTATSTAAKKYQRHTARKETKDENPLGLREFSMKDPELGPLPSVVYTRSKEEVDELIGCLKGPISMDLEWSVDLIPLRNAFCLQAAARKVLTDTLLYARIPTHRIILHIPCNTFTYTRKQAHLPTQEL